MILENGVIRTMDPSLPTARALAIAGAHVAGGVGTHETALPSPDVVDLGGRCVLPGFTDSHVHFPTWSLSQREVRLEGVAGPRRGARARARHPRHGSWIRGYGWRSAEWDEQPTAEALDAVTGDVPALLFSKDYHSAWLNSAALARAERRPQVDGGVVERDASGEPTGSPARGVRVAVPRARTRCRARTSSSTRRARACASPRAAASSRSTTRTAGSARRESSSGSPSATGSRCASGSPIPYERLPELEALGIRSGIGDDFLRIGYLKAFMDGTLGSQTAWMLDGSGVVDHERRASSPRSSARAHGSAGRSACTRSATARTARRSTPSSRRATRGRHSGCGIASSTRSASRPRTSAASRQLGVACSVQFSHAPSDRDLAERFWPEQVDGAYAFRSLLGVRRARRERLGRAGRGARPARRDSRRRSPDDRRAAGVASRAVPDGRGGARRDVPSTRRGSRGDERRRGKLLPGYLADLVVLSRDPLECPPDELETVEVVATMVGGRWVHNPPPWD